MDEAERQAGSATEGMGKVPTENAMQPMTATEIALRQSLELLNTTIQSLCLRRDLIASQLPNAPKQKMPTHSSTGMEIKLGGGKRRKKHE